MLAICGRSGEIFLLHSLSKELITTLKMNARCRALAFTPDSNTLITHGGKSFILVLYFLSNTVYFLFNINFYFSLN